MPVHTTGSAYSTATRLLASEHPQNTAIFEGVQMVMEPCQVLKETPGAPIHGQKSPGGLREVPERPTDSPRSRSF